MGLSVQHSWAETVDVKYRGIVDLKPFVRGTEASHPISDVWKSRVGYSPVRLDDFLWALTKLSGPQHQRDGNGAKQIDSPIDSTFSPS